MHWTWQGMDSPKKHKKKKAHNEHKVKSVGDAFVLLDKDQAIHTDADQNRRRRTLELTKKNDSWGFTLQTLTYGIRHKKTSEVEVMTYVDYVEINSSAWFAGLRRGDVILAVDGDSVDHLTHRQLVDRLKKCQHTMRLIVLFEDCHRKVELHDRLIKLKTILKGKLQELRDLEERERRLTKSSHLSPMDALRTGSISSMESSWDKYSLYDPSQACGKVSISSVSDDQDVLTDSLSMASSAYSEDDQSASLVASAEHLHSDTDSFSDSVFVSPNRNSVIFKPKLSLAPSKPENELIDEPSLMPQAPPIHSDTSGQKAEKSVHDRRNPNQPFELGNTLNQSELPIQNLSISDQSENTARNLNISAEKHSSCISGENGAIPKLGDREQHIDSKSISTGAHEKMTRKIRRSRLSSSECINETDEITKL